jgi:hypothetical protein
MTWLSRLTRPRVSPTPIILLSDDGFSLGDRGLLTVRWADVQEIVTFKRDLVSSDSIRLAFRTKDDPVYVEASEEMAGFDQLVVAMNAHFPEIPTDWLEQVTQPPFATNERRLFGTAPMDQCT